MDIKIKRAKKTTVTLSSEDKVHENPLESSENTSFVIPEPERIPEPREIHQDSPKSQSGKMVVGLVIAVAIAAFFVGYFVANNADMVTKSEFDTTLSRLESKIDKIDQPAPSRQEGPELVKVSLDDDPMKGNPNAKITILEFSDFQCPFCARFYVQTLPLLEEEYISTGKVNIVYRDSPIDSIHPNARPAHLAAECADEQDMFWEYHDALFESQGAWQRLPGEEIFPAMLTLAEELELDTQEFERCLLNTVPLNQEIERDLADFRNYGGTGTPTFFIGNDELGYVKITGAQPYSVFKQVIDSQLDA